MSYEQLADPRLIHTDDLVDNVADIIGDVLVDARDQTISRLESEFAGDAVVAAGNFDGIARNAINGALSDGNIRSTAQPAFDTALERTLDRLDSDVHAPRIQTVYGVRYEQQARQFARTVEFSTRNAADDMLDRMRTGVRHGATRGERIDTIVERIRSEFDDATLRNRARIIAHMEIQTAVESAKVTEYEQSPDVDGVRVINPCTDATTRLCEHLAGCGTREASVAWFDEDDSIGSQFQVGIAGELLFDGFNPLPPSPPFHFGCRSSLAPVVRDN